MKTHGTQHSTKVHAYSCPQRVEFPLRLAAPLGRAYLDIRVEFDGLDRICGLTWWIMRHTEANMLLEISSSARKLRGLY